MKKVESEKKLDRLLRGAIEKKGGVCLKLTSQHIVGLPDRLCLLRPGIAFFVEVKTTGKKPRKIQTYVHNRLRALGFRVYILDSCEGLVNILANYPNHDDCNTT